VNYGFVKTILNIILPKFNKIFYVNFNNDHIKGNFLQKVIIRSKNIKNVQKLSVFNKLNQFKIKNYYGCGDEFDNAFFNSYNLSDRVKLNFIEHGYGNLINTIIFKPSFKNLIYFAIIKLLYSLNLTSIYPLKYQDFLGVLGKNIKKKLDLYINNSKVNYIFLENVLKEIKLLIIKLNLKYRFKKKSVFLNFSTLEFPKKNNTDLDSLISSTIKKIRKNDFCFYTSHPRNKDQNKSIKYLIKKLKKLKIKLNFIDNKKFNYFPAELIIYFFNTHKIISNLSSIPLNISIIDKSIKNYIFLNYSLKHPNTNHGPAHNKSCKKYYLKYFKKVNYI
tara:strand:- start:589 stop:1587 length:999 start_codon:yes stop_codon:yes gene_type:complete